VGSTAREKCPSVIIYQRGRKTGKGQRGGKKKDGRVRSLKKNHGEQKRKRVPVNGG